MVDARTVDRRRNDRLNGVRTSVIIRFVGEPARELLAWGIRHPRHIRQAIDLSAALTGTAITRFIPPCRCHGRLWAVDILWWRMKMREARSFAAAFLWIVDITADERHPFVPPRSSAEPEL